MTRNLLISLIACFCLLLTGCGQSSRTAPKGRHVLVIHSTGCLTGNYNIRAIKSYRTARDKNRLYTVEMQHIFLPYPMAPKEETLDTLIHDMKLLDHMKWDPEVVVLHGDVAMQLYAKFIHDKHLPKMTRKPVVFTGVLFADTLLTHEPYNRMAITGFRDTMYIEKNLQLFRQMWGESAVCNIELDYTPYTRAVRQRLYTELADTALYENNADFHIHMLTDDVLLRRDSGKPLLVNFISAANANANLPTGPDDEDLHWRRNEARDNLRTIYRRAPQLHMMHVWYDIYTNSLTDHAMLPQLSMLNSQFGDTYPIRNLGGFFTDLNTQAIDALSYADLILRGTAARSIPIGQHKPRLYLDWRAMQRYSLPYSEWSKLATIINAPIDEVHPHLYIIIMVALSAIAGLLISLLILSILTSFYKRRFHKLLHNEEELAWILSGDESAVWKLSDDKLRFVVGGNAVLKKGFQSLPTQQFLELVHPDERELIRQVLNFELSEGEHQLRFRVKLDDNGNYNWYSISFILDSHSINMRTIEGYIFNIQEEKDAEDRLLRDMEASEETRIKEAFLANVSHDLRSPLASIVSFANLITDSSLESSPEEQVLFVKQIEANTRLMLHLLDDVMDLSKLQLGEYRYVKKLLEVRGLMDGIYHSYSVLIPDHISFLLEGSDDFTLLLDPARVTQIINNFLSNAIKATTSGSITLGWKREGNRGRLYVRDTGCGIEEKDIPRLFEKYTKFDGKGSGAGLGLCICKTMVEAQGGTIEVESKPGVGSTFSAVWEIAKEEEIKSL